ncbi:MAG: hypothetical protein ACW99U_17225 [Candidatus Thorarchaeota archaeon]
MGRKRLNPRPNVILETAIYSGLSALVRLAQRRKNDQTKIFYAGIEKKWNEVRVGFKKSKRTKPHDFSTVQNAEPKMRDHYLKMLWYSTRPYGNKEFKRVYDWREGTVGPLNALLNYSGAQLRNLAITRYPFPEPVYFQIRVYVNRERRVLAESVAERLPLDDAEKVYWRAGYRGNSKHPRILLTHPTLPGLDFVDMIRAHVIELCRQCFIYNVPMFDSHRYIRLLIHKLRPFLDWVYTQGETGRRDFFPDADRELRKIVLEIRTLYGKRIGRSERITNIIDDDYGKPTAAFLRNKTTETLNGTKDEDVKERCIDILKMIDQGLIVDRDVAKLMDHVLSMKRRDGNDWHRVLLSDLHHPPSLKSVIFAGDTMLESQSDVLIVGELPIIGLEGKGKADVTVFVRREISGRVVWTPVMLLELKTKTAFNFNLYSEMSRSGKDYLPSSYVWKTAPTDDEWSKITKSRPSPKTLVQLTAYEKGLIQEYRKVVVDDPIPPTSLWKGVILVDTQQRYSTVFDAFHDMLRSITDRLYSLKPRIQEWTSFNLQTQADMVLEQPRIAVIFTPEPGPSHLIGETVSAEGLHPEDPFEHRVRDDRHLTVYLSVPSPTSFGVSAAWRSKNWHLLNHMQEIILTGEEDRKVIWLDLLGDYPTENLLKSRFALEHAYKRREMTSRQYRPLSKLLESIEFIGLNTEINEFLSGQSDLEPKDIKAKIESILEHETIIVVDGWAEICELIPSSRQHLIRVLEKMLLDALPQNNVEVIWVEGGTNHTKMNSTYQRKCVRPLAHNSLRRTEIDEVIWNLPVPPRVFGWQTSIRPDVRLTIQDTPTSVPPRITFIQIPSLHDWAKRFRGTSERDKSVDLSLRERRRMYGRLLTSSGVQQSESISKEQITQDIMTLAPSLLRSRFEGPVFNSEYDDDSIWIVESNPLFFRGPAFSSTDLFHLCPTQPIPSPCRSKKKYDDLGEVTRGWKYGSIPAPDEYIEDWQRVTRRPLLTKTTHRSEIDTKETRRAELRRLLYAARFLTKQVSEFSDLRGCFSRIIEICEQVLAGPDESEVLLEALKSVKKIILSNTERENTWRLLYITRQHLIQLLNSENRGEFYRASDETKDVLMLYGNNLLLAVFAVAEKTLDGMASSEVIPLWSAVAEWQLYQMGFTNQDLPDNRLKSRYDFQAIYSNLIWRVKKVAEIPQTGKSHMIERFGQAVWSEVDGQYEIWFVFPDRKGRGFVGGLILNQSSIILRRGWYRGEIDPDFLMTTAEDAMRKWSRTPVLVTSIEGSEILWMKIEGEEEEVWACLGVMEYGSPPNRKVYPVRWLALGDPPPELEMAARDYIPSSQPPGNLDESINGVLRKAQSWTGNIQDVACIATLDATKGMYRIECQKNDSSMEVLASKDTPYTKEVIEFLRYPSRTGEYLTADDGHTLLRWDPFKDVQYENIEVGNRDWIRMTFLKPLVHRRSFFPDFYHIPQTCRELLKTKSGDDVKLVVSFDPKAKSRRMKKYTCISIEGISHDSLLSSFEDESMGIYDVALFVECEQLIDVQHQTRHDVEIIMKNPGDVRLPDLSEYDRIHSAIISVLEEGQQEGDIEEEDYDYSSDDIEVEQDQQEGPELCLIKLGVRTSGPSRLMRVTAYLGEKGDGEPLIDITVFEVSKETIKHQLISYRHVEDEMTYRLSRVKVNDETREEILNELCKILEKKGGRLSYDY